MLDFNVTAVMLSGPVAVPPKVVFSAGHPEAIVLPVVLHVEVMVRGDESPPGLGHGVVGVDFGSVGGAVLPVGDDGIGGELGDGLGHPLGQHLVLLTRG